MSRRRKSARNCRSRWRSCRTSAPAHDLLGFFEMVQGEDLPAAEQHLARAVQLEPENPGYQLSLAQVQLARNDPCRRAPHASLPAPAQCGRPRPRPCRGDAPAARCASRARRDSPLTTALWPLRFALCDLPSAICPATSYPVGHSTARTQVTRRLPLHRHRHLLPKPVVVMELAMLLRRIRGRAG